MTLLRDDHERAKFIEVQCRSVISHIRSFAFLESEVEAYGECRTLMNHTASHAPAIQLGLRENAAQFALLVVVNAFVGAMAGMERSILPS